MRTIGIVGGLSWEATALYYRLMNEGATRALGPHHNARSVIVSVDFAEALAMAKQGRWDDLAALLGDAAKRLCAAGADVVLLGANTAHLVADQVAAAIDRPLLHIVDAAGAAIRARGIRRVGLMGTAFTMDSPLFPERLASRFDVEVMLPPPEARRQLHGIITDELTVGRTEAASRQRCVAMIAALQAAGAEAVMLACTELPLLLRPEDAPVALFDTTALHVEAALRFALDADAANAMVGGGTGR